MKFIEKVKHGRSNWKLLAFNPLQEILTKMRIQFDLRTLLVDSDEAHGYSSHKERLYAYDSIWLPLSKALYLHKCISLLKVQRNCLILPSTNPFCHGELGSQIDPGV